MVSAVSTGAPGAANNKMDVNPFGPTQPIPCLARSASSFLRAVARMFALSEGSWPNIRHSR